jgi:hypothetical protein
MSSRLYKVTRDADGWIVRGPGGIIFDADWRWNSRSTAREVAREYNDRTPSQIARLQGGVA